MYHKLSRKRWEIGCVETTESTAENFSVKRSYLPIARIRIALSRRPSVATRRNQGRCVPIVLSEDARANLPNAPLKCFQKKMPHKQKQKQSLNKIRSLLVIMCKM